VQAIEALRAFFAQEPDVAAVYLYGRYAGDRSYPDTDIEIALLFPEETDEEAIRDYMDRLAGAAPLGGEPGILLPFALNTHIPPVIYEILHGGTLLVENHPEARAAAVRALEARVEGERASLLEDAKEAILQARSLGLAVAALDGFVLPQPPRYLDPIRVGWRLARVLGSAAVLDQALRDVDRLLREQERLAQAAGWYSNAVGAATGIAKAMLTMFAMPRPPRRWQVFLPLADSGLISTELALQLGAAVELRWSLMTGGAVAAERVVGGIRSALPPVVAFARLAAWYAEVPGGRAQPVH